MQSVYQRLLDRLDKKNRRMVSCLEGYFRGPEPDLRELNNYFRLALTKAPVCTINERECLVNDLSDDAWLGYFFDTVYPTLDQYDLPQE